MNTQQDTGNVGENPPKDNPLTAALPPAMWNAKARARRPDPHTRASLAGYPTIPVIPAGAPLPPEATYWRERGKCPGVCVGPRGAWQARDLRALNAGRTNQQAALWDGWKASAGIPGGDFKWLDTDITDPVRSEGVWNLTWSWLADKGKLVPGRTKLLRRVGQAPKWAALFRLDDPNLSAPNMDLRWKDEAGVSQGVQLLGRGKHAVAWGEHPRTGKPYVWTGDPARDVALPGWDIFDVPVSELVALSVQEALDLMGRIREFLVAQGVTLRVGASNTTGHGVPGPARDDLECPGGEAQVRALMSALPNDDARFPDRDDWLRVGQALLGALPEAKFPGAARELFLEWSDKYPPGQGQDPDREFDRFNPSLTMGWPYLLDTARVCGLGAISAGADFEEVDLELDAVLARVVEQLSRSADEAARRAAARGRGTSTADAILDSLLGTTRTRKSAAGAGAGGRLSIVSALQDVSTAETRAMGLGPRPFVYGHYYQRMAVSMLVGAGAVAKTNVSLVEAVAMAIDRPLLGIPVWEPGLRAAHLNWDENHDELLRRLRAVFAHYAVPWSMVRDRLWVAGVDRLGFRLTEPDGRGGHVLSAAGVGALVELIRELKLDVLQMDPLGAVMSGLNDNDLSYELMGALQRIAAETGCAIQVTHHTRKGSPAGSGGSSGGGGGESSDLVDAIKGASSLVQSARFARVLRTMTEKEATSFGVDPKKRRLLVRIEDAKANHVAPTEDAVWFRLESVGLGNAAGRRNEDKTGVPTEWAPPALALTPTQQADVLRALGTAWNDRRAYSVDPRAGAGRSAAALVASLTDLTEAQAGRLVQEWIGNGVVEVGGYDDRDTGRRRMGIKPILTDTSCP